ncbi:MAG: response regulator transcription factor [Myxococcales bacterium]|nr:response regulator transcription factor [Myxococcales bacterium]
MKLLVVEDDRKLATFLAKALTEEGYEIDACRNGRDAVARIGQHEYALVVLDWMIPELDGLAVCREVRRAENRVPILMLSARAEVNERVAALDAGADDYLTKPFHLEELLARVRAAVRRGGADRRALRVGLLTLDLLERTASVSQRRVDLTPREYALLALLAKNAGRVVSRAEILLQVWQTARDPGSNVIEVNVRHLREKLGAAAPPIETVRGAGYRLGEPESPP